MLPAIAYLDFAGRFYGQVRFDLASSGILAIEAETLGAPAPVNDLAAKERFCDAVAARYGVARSEVVPALGASGALFVAAATVLEPGSRLLVESPSYEPLWRSADALGIAVDRFERRFADGFRIDVDTLLEKLRPETRLVAITNPHNPTGIVLDDADVSSIAKPLAVRGVFLLVDEVYLELSRPGTTARKIAENVIACSSATKCWGVGWARAGWLFLPEVLAAPAARVERYVSGMAPPVCWAFGEAALASADRLLERANEIQRGKRALIDRFVESANSVLSWVEPPAASLFGWLRHQRGTDLLPILERGIEREGVLVAPGTFFGDPSAFRLGWTSDLDTVERGLTALSRVLELAGASP